MKWKRLQCHLVARPHGKTDTASTQQPPYLRTVQLGEFIRASYLNSDELMGRGRGKFTFQPSQDVRLVTLRTSVYPQHIFFAGWASSIILQDWSHARNYSCQFRVVFLFCLLSKLNVNVIRYFETSTGFQPTAYLSRQSTSLPYYSMGSMHKAFFLVLFSWRWKQRISQKCFKIISKDRKGPDLYFVKNTWNHFFISKKSTL
jgi:hypothetical protein